MEASVAKLPAPEKEKQEPILRRYQNRLKALEQERQSWDAHYQDVADHLLPRSGRLKDTQSNKGDKRNTRIINSMPLRSRRVLSAGLHGGITSPARPWFRITTADPAVAEVGAVKAWLHTCEVRVREAIAKSNLYNVLPQLYDELDVFGTACGLIDEDQEDGMRGYVFPCGKYSLAVSPRGTVDTVFRRFRPTVLEVVRKFGFDRVSKAIKNDYDRSNYSQRHPVIHAIEPNLQREYGRRDARNKPWRSCWFEENRPDNERSNEPFLKESGYEEFPILAPRWDVQGDDIYGRSPAMDALGDCRALQLLEERKLELVDKISNPPTGKTGELGGQDIDLTPGAVNEIPLGGQIVPLVAVPPQSIGAVREAVQDHEQRIRATFFEDLFLMLAQSDRRNITATEVAERHEEKLLQLGPVLERLNDELLEPLIDRVFGILLRRGEIPLPPKELQGTAVRIEFISILAQAQKMIATASVERLAAFVGSLVAAKPDVLDKLNTDEMVDEYADALGVNPDIVTPDEDVAALRERRAAQAQAMQDAAMQQQAVEGAKVMSQTDTGSDNALTRVLGGMAGGLPQ